MTITFVGHGYVGLVTAAVFADLGNTVWVIGHTPEKIENLKKGILPIYEPGLEEMVIRNVKAGRLLFTVEYDEAIPASEVVFSAVGTPPLPTGEADLSVVYDVAEKIGKHLDGYTVVVTKSTVPMGTNRKVKEVIEKVKPEKAEFDMASVPEFLREGQAIGDTQHPDRVVIGSDSERAKKILRELHLPITEKNGGQLVLTNIETAEMIKYASNAFLATKISFANAIAMLSEKSGANGPDVLQAVGLDKRIGKYFLYAGAGYGGSCFEGSETVFTLNSPNVATERLDKLFKKNGKPKKGDIIEYVQPENQKILAFDLQAGKPTLANVTAITKRPYKGIMTTIETSMGRVLKVTADHPVILYNENDFSILPASAVKIGDKLLTLCDLPEVKQIQNLNLFELLKGTELERDVFVTTSDESFSKKYKDFSRYIPETVLRYPEEIKQHNRMSLTLFRYLKELGVLHTPIEKLQLYTARGGAKINAIISVNDDLLRLLGYYLAEGYISLDEGRAGSVRERIGFCFHENETEYIQDVQNILQELGLNFIQRHATHAITTIISSRIFAWLIRDILQCGTNSENKALPRLVFNTPLHMRQELIKGAISGDGAFTLLQKGKNAMIEYATVSKVLADGITLLLQSVGVIPSIHIRWMNKSTQPAYILRVSGYEQLRILQNVFGNKRLQQIKTVLNGYTKHIKQRGFERHDEFASLAVQKVSNKKVNTMVYSMETTTGTLIASSGLISHNCFPKDVKALISIAEDYSYDFTLLKDVEAINKEAMHAIAKKIKTLLGDISGTTIGVLGLSFKPDTDDMRDAPSRTIIPELLKAGAKVKAYDPIAMSNAKKLPEFTGLEFVENAEAVAMDADILVLLTEWNEFKELDMTRVKELMQGNALVDGRNIYDPEKMKSLGFTYVGVGR